MAEQRNREGQRFGNYRLERLLGRGGFAEVYLGHHLRLQRAATIKILHAYLSENEIEAFQGEAQIIAALDHPHIVRLLDFDVQNGVPFLVMDYLPNGTLRQRHDRGERVPLPTVVSYVKQAALGIDGTAWGELSHQSSGSAVTTSSEPTPSPTPTPDPTPVPAGTTLYTYRGHSSEVASVAWSPDGTCIAWASDDKTVQVWKAK